jgi:hypothetical protein
MKFYWFGDSWVYGDEIDLSKDLPFAEIVSKHFDAECVNLGQCGSSIDDIPFEFYKIKEKLGRGDVVFFCLTANHRISLFDNDERLKRISVSNMYEKHQPHRHSTQWFKYFDTPAQRIYNYDKTINLLFLWCSQIGVKCYFANIFTLNDSKVIDIVPENCWIIEKKSCLAQGILPVVTKDHLYLDDHPDLTNEQFNQQKIAIEKFIRPNWTHPNSLGHQIIAETIIKKLKKLK